MFAIHYVEFVSWHDASNFFIAISMKTVKLGHGLISTYVADHVISATYSIYAVLICMCWFTFASLNKANFYNNWSFKYVTEFNFNNKLCAC